MRQGTTGKKKTILTLPVIRETLDHLRKPFIQRLITLVVSALLAMSLISTIWVLVLPSSGHEVTSLAFGKRTQPAHLDAVRIQGLVPKTNTPKQITQLYDKERRSV